MEQWKTRLHRLALLSTLLIVVGCEASKSSNPLSPSVAGPIPGVTITSPKLLEPGAGWEVNSTQQPLTLLIENALSTGVRPLNYSFEIATDTGFSNRVFTREGVPQGEGGRTSLRLVDLLASDRTYYWRARAQDGANAGPYAAPMTFKVFTPAVLDAPVPTYPVAGFVVDSPRPGFVVRNANRSGPVGAVSYQFQIATDEAFTAMVAIITVPEQPSETKFIIGQSLAYSRRHFWRALAYDSSTSGPWSATQTFMTPAEPPPPPPPPPAPLPSPSPAPAGGSCGAPYPNNGPDVIRRVEQCYPQYLVPTSTLNQRTANMTFIRDKIIETGKCGGMDLGWNLKRGGPEISMDFVVLRANGRDTGYDIAVGWDDYRSSLRLQWLESVFPFYKAYPTPSCK